MENHDNPQAELIGTFYTKKDAQHAMEADIEKRTGCSWTEWQRKLNDELLTDTEIEDGKFWLEGTELPFDSLMFWSVSKAKIS